ncbi:probable E3 ubiquitin-protein ligase DTX2 [Siniperca chuatsi]|uniref:probable E3 ubiquitin-protein ligase DTX2 n=1 Tax=Siniperca chuatsi TaxID=119488 RepID=UPI001CE0AA5E|nr:probable E3 ubiquitin-protein ligase DTX2 [Siniperca chuatsi]
MNPYRDTNLSSRPRDGLTAPGSLPSPPPYSPPDPINSHNPSLSAVLPSPAVIQTGHSSVTVLSHNSIPYLAPSNQDGGQILVRAPNSDRSTSPLPGSDPGFSLRSRPQSSLAPVSSLAQTPSAESATPNPYPAPATPPSCQVSVIIPSPDLRPSPLQSQCSEDTCPDLECSICFSQFNNVFRCPKMLQCKHTFCLECLARINVKSAQPNAIQCPLCRGLTPLPVLGLPRLATDPDVLSYLPAAMQRVYSIRFLRNKGKLQVKRSSEGRQRWGQRSLLSLRSMNRSLDVGLPSPPVGGRSEAGGVGGALFRLTGRPGCRAFLLTSVVMMMVMLTGIIIFLLTFKS